MKYSVWVFTIFILHLACEQATASFLQAISAALATIPLTGGPIAMTAGLAGVKLAVGSKLLYYLGLFGRGKPKASPVAAPVPKSFGQKPKPFSPVRGAYPLGYSVPLPYMFGAGGSAFRQPQLGFPTHSFPQNYAGQQFGTGQLHPSVLVQNFGGIPGAGQGQFSLDISPEYGNRGFSQAGLGNYASVGPSSQPFNEMKAEEQTKAGGESAGGGIPLDVTPTGMNRQTSDQMSQTSESAGDSDVDSFFNFLSEMDDNMCISRLICDIGADPNFLGEFSQNIDSIISSLEVPPDSRAHHYVSIMERGREERGGCGERFEHCTDTAYEIVKSVAPTVGVPSNLDDLNI